MHILIRFESLEQIKRAVDKGETVHWANRGYQVIRDSLGRYLVRCSFNGCCWGLTHTDGVTMNGKPHEFFTTRKEEA